MRRREKETMGVATLTEADFPDWRDAAAYGDYARWTYRRWAWEFLRRNPRYIDACHRLNPRGRPSAPGSEEVLQEAAKFGRRDLKYFNSPYDEKDRYWLSERVADQAWVESKEPVSKTFNLVPGQVAILFDVRPIRVAGPAALAVMLEHAKELLIGEYRAIVDPEGKHGYDAELGKVERVRKPRLKPKELLEKLRIYDAVVHQGASHSDVAEQLFADAGEDHAARKRVEYKCWGKAKEMIEGLKLLELVPRDHA